MPRSVIERQGSPPRMRGKAPSGVAAAPTVGITPAYAGKRKWPCSCRATLRDHPRICGEKRLCFFHGLGLPGSPPHMRGKVVGSPHGSDGIGITPAYAGKRLLRPVRTGMSRDHPRVCGEKPCFVPPMLRVSGSPPRMRGKVLCLHIRVQDAGITPAYAGKSL